MHADDPRIGIESIAYHRNGVGGAGFYVILFTQAAHNGWPPARMVATLFPSDLTDEGDAEYPTLDGNPRVAVLDRDLLAQDVTAFGLNSHRGDVYAAALLQAVQSWSNSSWERSGNGPKPATLARYEAQDFYHQESGRGYPVARPAALDAQEVSL